MGRLSQHLDWPRPKVVHRSHFTFDWDSTQKLDEKRFRAYTSLLLFRKNNPLGERIKSTVNCKISPNEAFLDRLAELFAKKKDGPDVAATLLVECSNKVILIVAKNSGFCSKDKAMKNELEHALRQIAKKRLRQISSML